MSRRGDWTLSATTRPPGRGAVVRGRRAVVVVLSRHRGNEAKCPPSRGAFRTHRPRPGRPLVEAGVAMFARRPRTSQGRARATSADSQHARHQPEPDRRVAARGAISAPRFRLTPASAKRKRPVVGATCRDRCMAGNPPHARPYPRLRPRERAENAIVDHGSGNLATTMPSSRTRRDRSVLPRRQARHGIPVSRSKRDP